MIRPRGGNNVSVPYTRCPLAGDVMALQYNQFGVRLVDIEVLAWPGFQYGFQQGELSDLFRKVNGSDTFDSCELRGTLGARFDGEAWTYQISQSSINLTCTKFATASEVPTVAKGLLKATRLFFADRQPLIFAPMEIYVRGTVPDSKGQDVGEIVRKKLLPKTRVDQSVTPPGLHGAGLRLVGDTDDFHWHANIEPSHGDYETLGLAAQLYFAPPPDPPQPEEDLDLVAKAIEDAYAFLTDHIKTFSEAIFK